MSDIHIALVAVAALFVAVAYANPGTSEFYLGTKTYGPLVSAISIVAAFTGGGALLNTTSLASKYGTAAFVDVVPAVSGLLVAALFVYIGFFGKKFSAAFFDIQSGLYDKKAVALHYLQVSFLYVLVIAAQLRAVAVVAEQTGTSAPIAVTFCCVIIAIYAYRGFDAVTRTDVLQILLMLPMYIILAFISFEPNPGQTVPAAEMPLSLLFALCLPLLFLPISQEIHQRGTAATSDKTIGAGYVLAAIFYAVLGSLLVIAFTKNPSLSISDLMGNKNRFAAIVVSIGFFAAILSTLDTSTNIASHAVQKLHPFKGLPPALLQVLLLAFGAILFLYFKTVLSLILFALFLYMAGPALTFLAVYAGIHPRTAAQVGVAACAAQVFIHFRMAQFAGLNDLVQAFAIDDPLRFALYALLFQIGVILALLLIRRLR